MGSGLWTSSLWALPREFADKLHPYVRAKYDELWQITQTPDPKPEA